MSKIIIIDDDLLVAKLLTQKLNALGHEVTHCETAREGCEKVLEDSYDVALLDVILPDGSGLDYLPVINKSPGQPEVIIITGAGDPDGAEIAIKNGAWDYLEKSSSLLGMILPITRALQHRNLKKTQNPLITLKRDAIIGNSPSLNASLNLVWQASQSNINVLIDGETGTGKELFALCVHQNCIRNSGNFVVVDCAALPENLVESMLFGHVKGAFTGAERDRVGLIRQADGGTLFLDEIGELPLYLQKAFLRALQEHRFRPVGSEREIQSDFRMIAATNRNLEQMVDKGHFRQDLLFRIRSMVINLPPLRNRLEDIEALANHTLDRLSARLGSYRKTMSPEYLSALERYHWPGNVRELFNCLERSVAAAGTESSIQPHHMPQEIRVSVVRSLIRPRFEAAPPLPSRPPSIDAFPSLEQVRSDVEEKYLKDLMKHVDGNVRKACFVSGLSRSRLYALLGKYRLSNPNQKF